MLTSIKIVTLPHFDLALGLPKYMSKEAAGADLCASLLIEQRSQGIVLGPGERTAIPTGFIFEIPHGFEVQIRPRSGLALKSGLSVINSPGTIDSDYRGEIKVLLVNLSADSIVITHGMRIAQMVVAPVVQAQFEIVKSVSDTERGVGGFGSTGIFVS